MPVKSLTQIKIREYAVSWNGVSIGWIKNADLSGLKLKTIDLKIEEVSDLVVDQVIVGLEGTIKTTIKQVKIETMRQLILGAPGTGSIPLLMPTTQYDSLYARAQVLNIHPRDMGATLTEDINILKAVPKIVLPKSSEGKDFQTVDVEWMAFPEQTELLADPSVVVYGYIGEIPEEE